MNRPKTDTCTIGFSSLSMSKTLSAYDSWQEKIGGSWKASLVRDFYGWLVGVQVMSFSTVLNALIGSLVPSLITRSKRPVTGVTDSMLLTRLSWLTMCPSSPLAFAKTKLVDADLDIFL